METRAEIENNHVTTRQIIIPQGNKAVISDVQDSLQFER